MNASAVRKARLAAGMSQADLAASAGASRHAVGAMAAALLPSRGPQRVIALEGSTGAALGALKAGRVHAALVHGGAGRLPEAPRGALRVRVARWRVGVASRAKHPRSVADLCEHGT